MEPLIEFGTQTCLETLSVFNSVFVFPCCFFDVVFVVALAKQMVV